MKSPALFLRLLALTSLLFALSGCVATIANREPGRPNVTLGQQLVDLKKARDDGAISEAEYAVQRAKFLEGK